MPPKKSTTTIDIEKDSFQNDVTNATAEDLRKACSKYHLSIPAKSNISAKKDTLIKLLKCYQCLITEKQIPDGEFENQIMEIANKALEKNLAQEKERSVKLSNAMKQTNVQQKHRKRQAEHEKQLAAAAEDEAERDRERLEHERLEHERLAAVAAVAAAAAEDEAERERERLEREQLAAAAAAEDEAERERERLERERLAAAAAAAAAADDDDHQQLVAEDEAEREREQLAAAERERERERLAAAERARKAEREQRLAAAVQRERLAALERERLERELAEDLEEEPLIRNANRAMGEHARTVRERNIAAAEREQDILRNSQPITVDDDPNTSRDESTVSTVPPPTHRNPPTPLSQKSSAGRMKDQWETLAKPEDIAESVANEWDSLKKTLKAEKAKKNAINANYTRDDVLCMALSAVFCYEKQKKKYESKRKSVAQPSPDESSELPKRKARNSSPLALYVPVYDWIAPYFGINSDCGRKTLHLYMSNIQSVQRVIGRIACGRLPFTGEELFYEWNRRRLDRERKADPDNKRKRRKKSSKKSKKSSKKSERNRSDSSDEDSSSDSEEEEESDEDDSILDQPRRSHRRRDKTPTRQSNRRNEDPAPVTPISSRNKQ